MSDTMIELALAQYRRIVRDFVRQLMATNVNVPEELSNPFYAANMPKNFVNDALEYYRIIVDLER